MKEVQQLGQVKRWKCKESRSRDTAGRWRLQQGVNWRWGLWEFGGRCDFEWGDFFGLRFYFWNYAMVWQSLGMDVSCGTLLDSAVIIRVGTAGSAGCEL